MSLNRRSKLLSEEETDQLSKLIRNFFLKSAILIIISRLDNSNNNHSNHNTYSNNNTSSLNNYINSTNDFFNLDSISNNNFSFDKFNLDIWNSSDDNVLELPNLIVECYLDLSDLYPYNSLFIKDHRTNELKEINIKNKKEIILERWVVGINTDKYDNNHLDLNSFNTECTCAFRELYTILRNLPCLKLKEEISKNSKKRDFISSESSESSDSDASPSSSFESSSFLYSSYQSQNNIGRLSIDCRVLHGEKLISSKKSIGLSRQIAGDTSYDEVSSRHDFNTILTNICGIEATVNYRNNCSFYIRPNININNNNVTINKQQDGNSLVNNLLNQSINDNDGSNYSQTEAADHTIPSPKPLHVTKKVTIDESIIDFSDSENHTVISNNSGGGNNSGSNTPISASAASATASASATSHSYNKKRFSTGSYSSSKNVNVFKVGSVNSSSPLSSPPTQNRNHNIHPHSQHQQQQQQQQHQQHHHYDIYNTNKKSLSSNYISSSSTSKPIPVSNSSTSIVANLKNQRGNSYGNGNGLNIAVSTSNPLNSYNNSLSSSSKPDQLFLSSGSSTVAFSSSFRSSNLANNNSNNNNNNSNHNNHNNHNHSTHNNPAATNNQIPTNVIMGFHKSGSMDTTNSYTGSIHRSSVNNHRHSSPFANDHYISDINHNITTHPVINRPYSHSISQHRNSNQSFDSLADIEKFIKFVDTEGSTVHFGNSNSNSQLISNNNNNNNNDTTTSMNFSPPPFQYSSSLQNSGVQFSHLLHNNNSTTPTTTNTQLDKLKALRESQNQFSDDLSASILNNLTSKRSSFNSGGSINYTNTSGLKQSSSRTGSGSSPGNRSNNAGIANTTLRTSSGYGSSTSGAPGSMPIPLAYNLRGSSASPGPGVGHSFIYGSGGSASGTGSVPGSGPHSHMDMNSPRGRHFLEDVNELPTSTSSTVHTTTSNIPTSTAMVNRNSYTNSLTTKNRRRSSNSSNYSGLNNNFSNYQIGLVKPSTASASITHSLTYANFNMDNNINSSTNSNTANARYNWPIIKRNSNQFKNDLNSDRDLSVSPRFNHGLYSSSVPVNNNDNHSFNYSNNSNNYNNSSNNLRSSLVKYLNHNKQPADNYFENAVFDDDDVDEDQNDGNGNNNKITPLTDSTEGNRNSNTDTNLHNENDDDDDDGEQDDLLSNHIPSPQIMKHSSSHSLNFHTTTSPSPAAASLKLLSMGTTPPSVTQMLHQKLRRSSSTATSTTTSTSQRILPHAQTPTSNSSIKPSSSLSLINNHLGNYSLRNVKATATTSSISGTPPAPRTTVSSTPIRAAAAAAGTTTTKASATTANVTATGTTTSSSNLATSVPVTDADIMQSHNHHDHQHHHSHDDHIDDDDNDDDEEELLFPLSDLTLAKNSHEF
ncbi:hypothetical protein B5S30_g3358 [[Candida] boidinii]|nr:hypothetical protein B5S30_g3358 [[Candida] boidinii]